MMSGIYTLIIMYLLVIDSFHAPVNFYNLLIIAAQPALVIYGLIYGFPNAGLCLHNLY